MMKHRSPKKLFKLFTLFSIALNIDKNSTDKVHAANGLLQQWVKGKMGFSFSFVIIHENAKKNMVDAKSTIFFDLLICAVSHSVEPVGGAT